MLLFFLLAFPRKKAAPLPSTYVATYCPYSETVTGLCVLTYQAKEINLKGYIPSPLVKTGKVAKETPLLVCYPKEAEEILAILEACEWELANAPSTQAGELASIRAQVALWRSAWISGNQDKQEEAIAKLRQLCGAPTKEADIARIEAVCQWLTEALPSPIDQYLAPYDAFFSLDCDGYESIWDNQSTSPLSCEEFKIRLSTPPTEKAAAKLIEGIETSLYLWLETASICEVALGKSYSIEFADGTKIVATLSAIEHDSDAQMSLLQFKSNALSYFHLPQRIQNVTLTLRQDALLRVPKEAVLLEGEQAYVLVRHGSRILARGIVIAHETEKWVYLSQRKGTLSLFGETCAYLAAGESVAIQTNGLYHRKVLS